MGMTLSFSHPLGIPLLRQKKKFPRSRKNYNHLASLRIHPQRGQMQIQQMAFMILAVFLFFILVGLFFLGIQFRDVKKSVAQLQTEQAISSLRVIADMSELDYDSHESMSLDEDKLRIMSGNFGSHYSEFWPVASVKVYKIYPKFEGLVKCPALNCNYFEVYESGQESVKTYSTYVSICKKVKDSGYAYDKCEIGKLVVGVISPGT